LIALRSLERIGEYAVEMVERMAYLITGDPGN
jgi:phosphate uptake regulator